MPDMFRQSALDRASSPERLDETIAIVPVRSWLLLVGLAVVAAGALLWGWLGTITTRVYGQAIIVSEGSFTHAIQPLATGRVVEVPVATGGTVRRDDVLVRLRVPILSKEVQVAEEFLQALEADHRKMLARQANGQSARDAMFAQQEGALRQRLADVQRLSQTRESQLKDLGGLAEQGHTTPAQLFDAQEQVDAARSAMSQALAELAGIAVERARADAEDAERLDYLAEQITDQSGKVQVLRHRLQEASEITSPIDGIVQELSVRTGAMVAEGQVLMTIRTRSSAFEALSFLPALQGNLVVPGMAAQLAPNGVTEEEFGSIRGQVQSVSDHPVSRRAVMELLQNEELVAAFFEEGPPVEARVTLEAKPDNASGFAWTAGKGPPFPVTEGTLGYVSVIVHEQSPITLVLPALRQLIGYN
jgi:HlyD family secretion protein